MSNVPTPQNMNDLVPAPPAGKVNIKWQHDDNIPRNVSAYVNGMGPVGITVFGGTSYPLSNPDNGSLIVFTNNANVAVGLTSTVTAPFLTTLLFLGTAGGTLTPTSGLVNGVASLTVPGGSGGWLFFDGTNWYFIEGTSTTAPATPTPVEGESVTFTGTSGTLAHTPSTVTNYTTVKLYRGGVRMLEGAGNDFTRTGAAITLAIAAGTENFVADYWI